MDIITKTSKILHASQRGEGVYMKTTKNVITNYNSLFSNVGGGRKHKQWLQNHHASVCVLEAV